jgi:hypothetical protein
MFTELQGLSKIDTFGKDTGDGLIRNETRMPI